jgi:hypothetical protein
LLSLESIKCLEIKYTNASFSGLKSLIGLKSLQKLELAKSDWTDKQMSELDSLFQNCKIQRDDDLIMLIKASKAHVHKLRSVRAGGSKEVREKCG